VSATFQITQDNTGLVTITPTGENAVSFDVDFGDGSAVSTGIKAGKSVTHTFTEATHAVKVTAKGFNNLKTVSDVQLVVSFKAPKFSNCNYKRRGYFKES
jgi:PKD repeat protein